jgi:hypothetical protein
MAAGEIDGAPVPFVRARGLAQVWDFDFGMRAENGIDWTATNAEIDAFVGMELPMTVAA